MHVSSGVLSTDTSLERTSFRLAAFAFTPQSHFGLRRMELCPFLLFPSITQSYWLHRAASCLWRRRLAACVNHLPGADRYRRHDTNSVEIQTLQEHEFMMEFSARAHRRRVRTSLGFSVKMAAQEQHFQRILDVAVLLLWKIADVTKSVHFV